MSRLCHAPMLMEKPLSAQLTLSGGIAAADSFPQFRIEKIPQGLELKLLYNYPTSIPKRMETKAHSLRAHTCHPGCSTAAAATEPAKNTAMKSISILLEAGLIAAESSSYFDKHRAGVLLDARSCSKNLFSAVCSYNSRIKSAISLPYEKLGLTGV